ncbi:hypothetical protein ABID22_000617 [Pontibacter aydingkolensis]|uniref:Lipoprotein n=1 Tax=Pontibacter aydingkolensis TaxID=1911536 RepID=A0ABS7CRM5_9BACT|nr:hypothetical protein [Pontibacter aydingkolensis]MBW7466507.1 hypothetical protein [Pontibacter aydingkolensis]
MRIFTKGLLMLAIGAMVASCSPLSRSNKAILVDDDGRSMRFNNGRQESKNKKWNSSKSLGKQQKKRDKAFKKRRRN